jgi:hypothetical protein
MAAGEGLEMDYRMLDDFVLLNKSVATAIEALQRLGAHPGLSRDGFPVYQAYLRGHLADANVYILETLHESEEETSGTAYRESRDFEKKIRDPDDCYLDVLNRERERRQQGLPSLIDIRLKDRSTIGGVIEAETEGSNVETSEDTGEDEDTEPEDGETRRQRIIARVNALCTENTMTKQELYGFLGGSMAERWRRFVQAEPDNAWNHALPQMFERLCQVLGVSVVEILR